MSSGCQSEVELLLEQWGIWARRGLSLHIGYARVRFPLVVKKRSSPSLFIEDSTAVWIDQCVGLIQPRHSRDALVMRYVWGASFQAIGIETGCNRATARRRINLAVGDLEQIMFDDSASQGRAS